MRTHSFGPRASGNTPSYGDAFYRDNEGLSFRIFNDSANPTLFDVARYSRGAFDTFNPPIPDFSITRYVIDGEGVNYYDWIQNSSRVVLTATPNATLTNTPSAPGISRVAPSYQIYIAPQTGIIATIGDYQTHYTWRIEKMSDDYLIFNRRLQSIEDRLTALEA